MVISSAEAQLAEAAHIVMEKTNRRTKLEVINKPLIDYLNDQTQNLYYNDANENTKFRQLLNLT